MTHSAKDSAESAVFTGILLYLPTTIFVPNGLYLLILLLLAIIFGLKLSKQVQILTLALLTSSAISLAFFFAFGADLTFTGNILPIQVALIVSLLLSHFVSRKVICVLVACLAIEFCVGVLQYSMGVSTFFPGAVASVFHEGDLLYNRRVYGLSSNSSVLAAKAIVVLSLSVGFFWRARKFLMVVFALVVATAGITFSRSAFVSLLVFAVVYMLSLLSRKHLYALALGLVAIVIASLLALPHIESITYEFARGRDDALLTGRPLIWSLYLEEITSNLVFGNYGIRNFLYIPPWGYMHAHSSPVMLLYVTGLLPLLVFVVPIGYLLLNAKIRKLIALAPLVTFSLVQYVLFWGISFADISFFALLFQVMRSPNINQVWS